MSNKNKTLIILAIVSLIIISFVGGQSFSKYIAQIDGTGVAEVAQWRFKVNGYDGEEQERENISLASTLDNETLIDNKIAPGTSGSFDIIIDATGSDVGVDYKVEFGNEQNKPTNLKFIYEDKVCSDISELQDVLKGTIDANEQDKIKTLKINWEWKYETGADPTTISENDKTDTKEGKTITNYTFDIIVTGTQVIPA